MGVVGVARAWQKQMKAKFSINHQTFKKQGKLNMAIWVNSGWVREPKEIVWKVCAST